MNGWFWALIFKPLAGLAMIAAYYFIFIKGMRWLYRALPKNKFVDALFRERFKNATPEYGPEYELLRKRGTGGSGTGTELQ